MLAAIQGLHKTLEETRAENAELKNRLSGAAATGFGRDRSIDVPEMGPVKKGFYHRT